MVKNLEKYAKAAASSGSYTWLKVVNDWMTDSYGTVTCRSRKQMWRLDDQSQSRLLARFMAEHFQVI